MPADSEKAVIVTGLVRNEELLRRCLAPFTALLERDSVDRVIYCTWDDEAAGHAELLSALQGQGVQLVTPPDPGPAMPDLGGGAFASVYYQSAGIRAALAALSAPDTVVLKVRSDLIMCEAFAARLFEDYPRQQSLAQRFHFPGVEWEWPLADILRGRLWISWVDLSLPFMMADECFMGFGADIEALCGEASLAPRNRIQAGAFQGLPAAHIYRYLPTFAAHFPVFRAYERLVHHFKTDKDYKRALLPVIFQDPFFWKVFALHAFVVRHYFYVDCGVHHDIRWYNSHDNVGRDWSDLAALKISPYYEHPPEASALNLDSFDANLGNYTLNCLDESRLRRLFDFQLPISDLLKLFYTSLRAALEADEADIAGEAETLRRKLEALAAGPPPAGAAPQ